MKLHHQIQGEGRPLLILHGLFGSSANWRGIATRLADGCKVVTVDLRNHGLSPHSDIVSYPSMANDIAELIADLNLNQVDIIGHSIGGKVAMTLAGQYPATVNNLIVVDIAPKAYIDRHSDIFEALLAIDLKQVTKRSDADIALSATIDNKVIRQFLLKNLTREENGFKWCLNLIALSEQYSILIEPVCEHQNINQRSLFVRGGRSDYIENDDIESIQQQFSDVTVVTLEQAGHWLHAEFPDQFITAIQRFLSYD